jgi:hypothetical protein
MVHPVQTDTYLLLRLTLSSNGSKWASTYQCHLGISSDAPKTIFEPIARSVQNVQLSCIEINTTPNRPKQAFHLTHITLEVHEVRPPRFPCPWYIRGKPRTYLTPRLTLSSNGLKPASTRPMSPRSSIGCSKNNFWAYCSFSANRAPILRRD